MGMGGSGKTQLALHWCKQPATTKRFNAIFWMDANSPRTLNRSFEDAAGKISQKSKETVDVDESVAFVKEKLETRQGNWLLVFDNLDDPSAFATANAGELVNLRNYFPKGGNGAIIITTRNAIFRHFEGTAIEVGSMTQQEGLQLFFGRSKLLKDKETPQQTLVDDAIRILEALGFLALAIAQAASYILTKGEGQERELYLSTEPLKQYLSAFQTQREKLLKELPRNFWEFNKMLPVDQPNGETKDILTKISVFTSLDLSFELLGAGFEPGKSNSHVLNLCAYFHNEDISENLFRAHFESKTLTMDWMNPMFSNGAWDSVGFNEKGTEKLKQLFFVHIARHKIEDAINADAPTVTPHLSIHPLVRDWLQLRAEIDARQGYLKETIEMLDKFITSNFVKNATPSEIRRTLAHLDVCIQNDARYLDGHGLGYESLRDSGIRFANFYRDNGQYVEAEKLYERGIEGSSSPDDEQTLMARDGLGVIYRIQGRLRDAENILSEVLRISDQQLGPDHIDSLVTANNLAIVYKNTGQYEKARNLSERTRAKLERNHDLSDRTVMKIKLDNSQILGSVYRYLGQPSMAEPSLLEAFEGFRDLWGPRDRETLGAAASLAAFYAAQGRYREAEKMYSQTFQDHEEVFGKNHPQTIQVLLGKASACSLLLQLEEAQQQYQNALERSAESSLGPKHPIRTKILEGLGLCHREKGEFDEAEELYRQVVENNREILGPDHHDTVGAADMLQTIVLARQTRDRMMPGLYLLGKKLRSHAQVQFHAEKSGHENFAESTEDIAPLTEEEKKAKLEELRARLREKRENQSIQDKIDQKRNEVRFLLRAL